MKAYVFIEANPGQTSSVYDELAGVHGLIEKHQVMGPYDIVAKIDVPTLADVPVLLSTRIRMIAGVERTTTLVAFPEEARLADLRPANCWTGN